MISSRQNEHAMVIKRASLIAQRLNSIELGIEKSLMISSLKRRLQCGIVRFVYLKKSGEIRNAIGTLDRVILRAKVKGNGSSPEKHGCYCYFDLEKGQFRSFCWENLIVVYPN